MKSYCFTYYVDNRCRSVLIRATSLFRFDRYSLKFEVRVATEPNPFGIIRTGDPH